MSVYKRTVRGKRARRYSIDYVDEGGVNRTVSSGTSDKRLAEQIKRKLVDRARAVQAGLVDPSEARLRSEADRPLAQHVNEYVEALVPLDGLSPDPPLQEPVSSPKPSPDEIAGSTRPVHDPPSLHLVPTTDHRGSRIYARQAPRAGSLGS